MSFESLFGNESMFGNNMNVDMSLPPPANMIMFPQIMCSSSSSSAARSNAPLDWDPLSIELTTADTTDVSTDLEDGYSAMDISDTELDSLDFEEANYYKHNETFADLVSPHTIPLPAVPSLESKGNQEFGACDKFPLSSIKQEFRTSSDQNPFQVKQECSLAMFKPMRQVSSQQSIPAACSSSIVNVLPTQASAQQVVRCAHFRLNHIVVSQGRLPCSLHFAKAGKVQHVAFRLRNSQTRQDVSVDTRIRLCLRDTEDHKRDYMHPLDGTTLPLEVSRGARLQDSKTRAKIQYVEILLFDCNRASRRPEDAVAAVTIRPNIRDRQRNVYSWAYSFSSNRVVMLQKFPGGSSRLKGKGRSRQTFGHSQRTYEVSSSVPSGYDCRLVCPQTESPVPLFVHEER